MTTVRDILTARSSEDMKRIHLQIEVEEIIDDITALFPGEPKYQLAAAWTILTQIYGEFVLDDVFDTTDDAVKDFKAKSKKFKPSLNEFVEAWLDA